MTAAEYQALAADLAREAAEYRALTEQHTIMGAVFDHNAPLPPAPNYRPREWETTDKEQA